MTRRLLLVLFIGVNCVSTTRAQPAAPVSGTNSLPQPVHSPAPVYRPEWAKQGLTGKGVVLVTIDTTTGKVSGVKMLQSTGNKLLDGAALEAYSQWRFKPGSVPQVKMPIEFASRPPPQASKLTAANPNRVYLFLIFLGLVGVIAVLRKRRM